MKESAKQDGARIVPADEAGIQEATARLRDGRLVAFPTETVYGLGANALDADAVAGIFTAKGRPSTNPLIVHVADVGAARTLAATWPAPANALAARFWPGPLTLVVEKASGGVVPDIVTAGGPTVGLRVPDHPVALALLRASGVPVAAPSANRSEEVSPTTAAHVADSLGPWVDDLLILDGGPCRVGLESTVVDVTEGTPRILRPGRVTADEIAAAVGVVAPEHAATNDASPARSPGQMARHYAPRKPLLLYAEPVCLSAPGDAFLRLPDDPAAAGARLYAELRRLDADPSVSRILAVLPAGTATGDAPGWAAIHDLLRRAAAPREKA